MNRETAKRNLPYIQAFAEGKIVQIKTATSGWKDIESPSFEGPEGTYRIKPEPEVNFIILRNDGSNYLTTPDENKAIDAFNKIKDIGTYKPYSFKKFVQDMDYQPPA